MKKLFTILLILAAMLSTFFITSYASEEITYESNEDVGGKLAEEEASEKESSGNIFDTLYGEAIKNADKILSALAFASSLVLAFCYKSGFLPLVNSALGKISDRISELTKNTKESEERAVKISEAATQKLEDARCAVDNIKENLTALEKRLDACASEEERVKHIYTVLFTQVDMLTEIFMSSSLPAYQKDKVSEKISEMKKSLSVGDTRNEE